MEAGNSENLDRFVAASAAVIETLSTESKLKLLEVLAEIELSVGALSRVTEESYIPLRRHIATLGSAGHFEITRKDRGVPYSIQNESVLKVLRLLEDLFAEEQAAKQAKD